MKTMPKRKRLDAGGGPNNENVCQEQLESNSDHVLDEKVVSTLTPSAKEIESGQIIDSSSSSLSSSATTAPDQFKSPLNPIEIRRKSNRILSLKRLNQNLVSSSSEDASSESSSSSCTTNSSSTISNNNNYNENNKPNQTSDVSSSLNPTNAATTTTTNTKNSSNSGKSLRKIQAWTEDDIRWFFEALCEHGKDFPNIQSYMATRCEKKGIPTQSIKTYEQVRHFYYRMWHKISQILNISAEVEKGIQEIYGLINYGELWKKFGSKFECKLSFYLQQLVDYGYTVVKTKGKSVRIRTPVCKALKKVHNIDSKISKPITQPIPKEIVLELIPATNADWLHVHSLAQNPRLRTKLTMQQRLSTVIGYLERRWNMNRMQRIQFRSVDGEQDDAPTDQQHDRHHYCLCLRPQNSAKLCDKVVLKSTANSISYNNYRSTTYGTTQIDLSLSAYMKNMFNDNFNLKKSKIRKSNQKRTATTTTNNNNNNNNNLSVDQPNGPPPSTSDGKDTADKDANQSVKNTHHQNNQDDNNNAKNETIENEEQHPLDLLKLLDSMNEELDEMQNTGGANNNNKNSPRYSNWKQESIGVRDSADRNDEDTFGLPEPPEHQTLAQWLAGESDNVDVEDEPENEVVGGGGEAKNPVEKSDDTTKPPTNENDTQQSFGQNLTTTTTTTKEAEKTNALNIGNKKRRISADINDTVNLLTAETARLGWNRKTGETVTVGELYLLFGQPTKIILEYAWKMEDCCQNDAHAEDAAKSAEGKEAMVETGDKIEPIDQKSFSTLQKFLVAASITLANIKKSNNNSGSNNNGPQSSTSLANSLSSSSTTSSKTGRKRGGSQQKNIVNSQLLSNLIQETILNDADPDKVDPIQSDDHQKPFQDSPKVKPVVSNNKTMANAEEKTLNPVPKSQNPQTINNKTKSARSTTHLDDPTKVEEVLKELKIRSRQRRPMTKFLYNQNKMNNINNGTRPTYLVIRAANLNPKTGADGLANSSKQIVLTAEVPSQASISLQPNPTTSSSSSTLSSNDHQQPPPPTQFTNTSSVLIPVQLETKPMGNQEPIAMAAESTAYLQLIQSQQQQSPINDPSIDPQFGQPATDLQECRPTTIMLKSLSSNNNNIEDNDPPPTMPWLNDVNHDISLGSLFDNCDNNSLMVNGGGGGEDPAKLQHLELPPLVVSQSSSSCSSSMPLTNFIETHINTFANDNSIDLMAKFADLAEQITSNDVKI